MWGHYNPQRVLLSLHELREHERVFVRSVKNSEMAKSCFKFQNRSVVVLQNLGIDLLQTMIQRSSP